MHRLNLRVVGLGVAALGALAIVAAFLLASFGSSSSVQAAGGPATPTPTAGPAPTAKPTGAGGALTGVSDIVVDGGVPTNDAYHCISYTQDRGDGTVKTAAVCNDNLGVLANTDAEPLDDPVGEGPDGVGFGPPPPPPYAVGAPSKGAGTLSGDNLSVTTCFSELGPPSGPNIIAVLSVTGAVAQLGSTGKQVGSVDIYTAQSDAACAALVPVGLPAFAGLGTSIYPAADTAVCLASNCIQSAFRNGATPDTDWDNDGCTDEAELDKLDGTKCGNDPWNPNDTNLADTDVAGDYSLLATAIDSDTASPGIYYPCLARIEQLGLAVKAFVNCYIDSVAIPVNPQMGVTCPNRCGDGYPGSPPPGITVSGSGVRNFADIDTKATVLTGTVDTTKNLLLLSGCFEDVDGMSVLGNVYVRSSTDLHTGEGFVEIHTNETTPNCTGGTPANPPGDAQLSIARQRKAGFPLRDSDSDGCGDAREMGSPGNTTSANTLQGKGGLRDPSNHYDYMNPTNDGLNRVDDILATVGQYFDDDGDSTPGYPPFTVGYNQDTDRTALTGGNAWNLGNPNGQQRVDDILASVKQYFHDCNTSAFS